MNFGRKIAAFLLIAALLIPAAGCGQDTAWVYQLEEKPMPAGVYVMYLLNAYAEAENTYINEKIEEDPTFDYTAIKQKDVLAGQMDGQKTSDWVLWQAQRNSFFFYAVERRFAEMGLALTQEQEDNATLSAKSIWDNYGTLYNENGIGESSLTMFYRNQLMKQVVFDALYGPEGEKAVSEDELKGYFNNEYAKAAYLYFPKYPEGILDENITLEEYAGNVKVTAEGYLERLKDGEVLEDLYYEQALANAPEDQKDSVTKPEPGSRNLIVAKDDPYYSGQFTSHFFTSKVGEPTLVEDDYAYYVINRIDLLEDPADFEYYREALLQSYKGTEFEEALQEYAATLGISHNPKAIARYTPDKLKVRA